MPQCKYDGQKDSNGDPHGVGVAIFQTGRYRGQWACGVFHGRGELALRNGTHYVGEFQDNKFHGKGACKWSNGNLYEGEFQYGKMHGTGHLKMEQGLYEGTFNEGKRQGKGSMTYVDESLYTGDWKADKMSGHGKLVDKDGVQFEGKWQGGVMNGVVHMTKKSGSVYRQLYLDGRLSTSERIKAGPSFIERWLFGNNSKEGSPAGSPGSPNQRMSPKSASPNMRPSTAPQQMEKLARHFDANSGLTSPVNQSSMSPSSAMSPRDELPAAMTAKPPPAAPTKTDLEKKENLGSDDDDDDQPVGSPTGLQRVKSLKDMSLKKTVEEKEEEAASPLGRRASMFGSMRRPNSAGDGNHQSLIRKASFTAEIEKKATRAPSPDHPANRSVSPSAAHTSTSDLETSINSTLEQLPKKGSFSTKALSSPQEVESEEDDDGLVPQEEMTDEQRQRVEELNRKLSMLGSAPLPPGKAPLPPALARQEQQQQSSDFGSMGSSDDSDVFSPVNKEKRRMSTYESKLDNALEAGLQRKASIRDGPKPTSSVSLTSPNAKPSSPPMVASPTDLSSPGGFIKNNNSFNPDMLKNSSFINNSFAGSFVGNMSIAGPEDLSSPSFGSPTGLRSPENTESPPQRSKSFLANNPTETSPLAQQSQPQPSPAARAGRRSTIANEAGNLQRQPSRRMEGGLASPTNDASPGLVDNLSMSLEAAPSALKSPSSQGSFRSPHPLRGRSKSVRFVDGEEAGSPN